MIASGKKDMASDYKPLVKSYRGKPRVIIRPFQKAGKITLRQNLKI
jgi:hypothetical protein